MEDHPVVKGGPSKPDRMRQLEILDRIGTTISSDLSLESIVQQVTDCATELTGNARLLLSAQRLASIVESSDDAIIGKDLTGIITSWNRGAQRIFGYTANEAIGRPITMLIPPENLHEEPRILERIIKGERIEHYETVRQRKDGSKFYIAITVSPIRDHTNTIVGASKIARDISELRLAQERRELLLREMNHRIKNLFAVASGVVAISARSATSSKDLAQAVQARLTAMARAHQLTLPAGAAGLDQAKPALLKELAQAVLSPYQNGEDGEVIAFGGPAVPVGPNAATNIALLLHEVVTNSVKYGALSSPSGRVTLNWTSEHLVTMRWAETGGPPVGGTPVTEGFGSTLSRMTAASLNGTIERQWHPGGLVMHLSVPATSLER